MRGSCQVPKPSTVQNAQIWAQLMPKMPPEFPKFPEFPFGHNKMPKMPPEFPNLGTSNAQIWAQLMPKFGTTNSQNAQMCTIMASASVQ